MIGANEYYRIHRWLKREFGAPKRCQSPLCPRKFNRFVWALKRGCEYEFKRENFITLCVSCHPRYDARYSNTGKYQAQTVAVRVWPSVREALNALAKVKRVSVPDVLAELLQKV